MEDNYKLENYERFFGEFKKHGAHWDKIEKIDEFDISQLSLFFNDLIKNQEKGFYKNEITRNISNNNYHLLQIKVIEKNLSKLPANSDFDFTATDRDANLDIPYMD